MAKKLSKIQLEYARKLAKKYVDLKLKLESPFKKELKSYFVRQTKRVRAGLELESIKPYLEKQYSRIAKKMNKVSIKEENEALQLATIAFFQDRANDQSDFIDKTTAKNLRRSQEVARQELAGEGSEFPSQASIAIVASSIFRGINKSRVAGIGVYETQGAVEGLRATNYAFGSAMMETAILSGDTVLAVEASEISESLRHSEVVPQIGQVNPADLFVVLAIALKSWVTMGDSKVRDWHDLADGQTVSVDQPFIVMGQALMHPGDMSMGATIENVAGCRCSAVYL